MDPISSGLHASTHVRLVESIVVYCSVYYEYFDVHSSAMKDSVMLPLLKTLLVLCARSRGFVCGRSVSDRLTVVLCSCAECFIFSGHCLLG